MKRLLPLIAPLFLIAAIASELKAAIAVSTDRILIATKPIDTTSNAAVLYDLSGSALNALSLPEGALLASDENRFLVVWTAASIVRGMFISSDGVASVPFDISDGEGAAKLVEWDGSRYVVLWERDGSTLASEVSSDGVVGPSFPLLAGERVSDAVGHDGMTALVWMNDRARAQQENRPLELRFAHLIGTTLVHQTTIAEYSSFAGMGSPIFCCGRIAWNGERYLVTWRDGRTGRYSRVVGRRLSASGTLPNAASTDGELGFEFEGGFSPITELHDVVGMRDGFIAMSAVLDVSVLRNYVHDAWVRETGAPIRLNMLQPAGIPPEGQMLREAATLPGGRIAVLFTGSTRFELRVFNAPTAARRRSTSR